LPANGTTVDLDSTTGLRATGTELRFASYNVHKCIGIDRRFDPERIARVIGELGADVVALQEADRRFGEREGLLDLRALERDTGLAPVPVASRFRSGHGWHGNLLLVRSALVRDVHQIRLPGLEPRGALVADIELSPGPVRVVAAHLGLLRHSRLMQVEALLAHAGMGTDNPTVLMGDLNEWRRRRRSALHSFAPRFGPLGHGVPSFPSYFPVLALDRILARPHSIVSGLEAHDTPLARLASDHLPIKARIRLGAPDAAMLPGLMPNGPEGPACGVRRSPAVRLRRIVDLGSRPRG
jgi:endonuclease/exonuclease/phosphatase family metal-dependent hydrolase